MGARGKKSAASLSVVPSIGVIQRPEPPSDLTTDQANEWVAVVNRMPADWFPRETHAMLAHYCRHVVSARRVGDLIENLMESESSSDWVGDYDRLLKMQEREGRALSSLATRMRISQQASYDKKKGHGKVTNKPPHVS